MSFRALVEQLPLVTYVESIDSRGVSRFYMSPQWSGLFRLDPVQAIDDWIRQVHPDDRDRTVAEWERVKAGGGSWRQEYRLVNRDGAVLSVRDEAVVLRNTLGLARALRGFVLDISDIKHMEEELQAGRALLRTVLDTDPSSIYVKDGEGRYLLANASAAALYGTAVEDVMGRRQQDLRAFADADIDQFLADDRRVLESGELLTTVEAASVAGTGDLRWFETHKAPITLPGGERAVLGVSRDITEQRQAQEALAEREVFFRTVLDADPSPIAVKDEDGRFIFVNAATARIYGLSVEEVTGALQYDVHPNRAEVDDYLRDDRKVLASGLPLLVSELVYTAPDGSTRYYETHKVPMQVGGRRAVLVVEREITERKLAEQRLRRSEEDVRRLNAELEQRVQERTAQLEAMNRELESFSYSVSHDLRAPLRSIDGFSHALLDDYETQLDEAGRDYLHRVRRAAQRMGDLIDDLLNLSRLTRGTLNLQDVDLSEIARPLVEQLHLQDPGRTVDFRIAPGVKARCDPRLLRILFENLFGNAWKFTAPRGDARIEFGDAHRDGHRAYFVRDNGAGFDMAYADKLFKPFQRLHGTSEFHGNGIGLATVQRIIHRHGGQVWAESQVGQGAAFYFTLGEGEEADA